MPRLGTAGELFKKVTALSWVRIQPTSPGDTTTTAAVLGTGAETTVAVTSSTGFTTGDLAFIIGDGGHDLVKIGTPAASMPVTPPPKIAQSTGARFVEAESVALGKYAQDSISWTANKTLTSIFEEIADTAVVQIESPIEFSISFGILNYSLLNLQFSAGYADAETGDGLAETTAHQVLLGGVNQAVHGPQVIRLDGLKHDLKKIRMDFTNAQVETAINANVGKSNASVLNVTCKCSQIIARSWV